RLAAAGAVAAAVGAAGLTALDSGAQQGFAATPPLLRYVGAGSEKPQPILERIAANTAKAPDLIGDRKYSYLKARGWALWTRVDGRQVTSRIQERSTERWWASDGSWRLIDRLDKTEDERGGPGTDPYMSRMFDIAKLSTDPKALKRQLAVGHPGDGTERLVAVGDLYRVGPIRPRLRAAVLRSLKDVRGLVYSGRVTDRAGRTGLAFSVESAHSGLPTRHTLIFDERSGSLLGIEQLLTVSAGKLNVPIPSVISYEMFLAVGTTDSVDTRP
ncbi:CU044_5270 family protein, partial [Actinocorallia lasiicapitis]